MSKTLIETICERLDIHIGETFFIQEHGTTPYKFTNSNIMMYDNTFQDDWVNVKPEVLGKLILGQYTLVMPEFNPTIGTIYYGYNDYWEIAAYKWGERTYHDVAAKYAGCVFRTMNEAKNCRARKYEELTGRKWLRD